MTSSTTFPHSNPFAISVSTGSQRMTTWYMKHKFYPYAPMCLALYLSTYLAATFYNCPHSTKAEMCSVTFSLGNLGILLIE